MKKNSRLQHICQKLTRFSMKFFYFLKPNSILDHGIVSINIVCDLEKKKKLKFPLSQSPLGSSVDTCGLRMLTEY